MSNGQLFEDDSGSLDPDKVLANLAAPGVMRRWEGSLREMVEIAEAALRQSMGDSDKAADLARRVVFGICDTMGGAVIYLPRGELLKKAMRDAEIYREWHDLNAHPADLARKHRLANQTIYDIIARQRQLHRSQMPDLFGFDDQGGNAR